MSENAVRASWRKNKLSFAGRTLVDSKFRHGVHHGLVAILARLNGFRLYNKYLIWHTDEEFLKAWRGFGPNAVSVQDRKYTLFNFARALKAVPGDLAECGIFQGASSYLMLAASEGSDKKLCGFDSFEGLSEPGEFDSVSDGRAFEWKQNDLSVAEATVRTNLSKYADKIELYKGWIPERFSEIENRRFSLVHIDVDLYDPTYASVAFFYPRLSKGGAIVCDDYGFTTCPGAKRAMDEFAASQGTAVASLPTGQGVLFKA